MQTAIAELEGNQIVEGIYMIQNCQLGQTKAGKPFIKCLLADKTGRTPGRMWNANEAIFRALPTNGFVQLEGQSQPYQGEMQVIIQTIMPVEPTEDQLRNLLPTTEFDVEEMYGEVKTMLESFTHPATKAIAEAYLSDDALMTNFKQSPAAQTLHHAFLGGLLEHTRQLMRMAEALLPFYPKLNRDIVLLGLFLHDLAKTSELSWASGFAYTDEGELVGHIAKGAINFSKRVDAIRTAGTNIPEALENVLINIIISHHGQPEYGALKIPGTPEAQFVSHLDGLDAKVFIALDAVSDSGSVDSGNFTEKLWAIGTKMYKGNPLED